MRAYGEMEQHGKYTLEDFGGWSRNHTKAASIIDLLLSAFRANMCTTEREKTKRR